MTRTTGIDQVWIDAVVASKEAAQRERDIALKELAQFKQHLLSGRIIVDETENGDRILLDTKTNPAKVIRV